MSLHAADEAREFVAATQAELARFVRDDAAGPRQPLWPVGGRTALHYGYPPDRPGIWLPTTRLNRTIDYPARDLTVTVEAGMRVDELAAMLRSERQQLAVDVPQSHRATLGGIVASNVSGPRRYGYGTLRDFLIGVSAVDGQGRLFHAGGRVVKNVAGYDLCKLVIGSLGTLAVITQLTFKLRPLPESSSLLWGVFDSLEAIDAVLERLLMSVARPVALEVLDPGAAAQLSAEARLALPAGRPVLAIGVEGAPQETAWQIDVLRGELGPHAPRSLDVVSEADAVSLWAALTEFETETDAPLTFRANLPPSATLQFIDRATRAGVAVQAHAGNGIVVGHLPDEAATLDRAAALLTPLREFARAWCGNLVILNCPAEWKGPLPVFGDSAPTQRLMLRLKSAFDPHGLLNPGRFLDARGPGTPVAGHPD